MKPLVTILVPHYKTLELTKICLQLIKSNTPHGLYKIIVIDNNSQDGSVEYLRQLKDIELIERKPEFFETVGMSHAGALDLALKQVDTKYVLSIHTDTLVHHPKWLEYLLSVIEDDEDIGGVGSWKLEYKSVFRRFLKQLERFFVFQQPEHYEHYLRSHCALYRTELIKKYNLSFGMLEGLTAGKAIHRALCTLGHKMIFLSSEDLGKYVDHINHATMILNPNLGADKRTIRNGKKRIDRCLKTMRTELQKL